MSQMSQTNPTILVTGGAGYIGSHTVLALQRANYEIIVLDNLVSGHRDIVENGLQVKLIVGDINDRTLLDHIFVTYPIAVVMHFAAYICVGESVTDPDKYYRNNVTGTLTLLEAMIAAGVKKFVFSSTSAIYGIPKIVPIPEAHPPNPISPYARSKLMVEQILADFEIAYDLNFVCFRYFNAAGADPTGLTGEDRMPETHLIPLLLLTALGLREYFHLFGTDYPTEDGTCIRDYIHVTDLANAHVLGLQYLLEGGHSEIFNLGNGSGFSVQQVIENSKKITGRTIKIVECERRPGDAPILISNSDKAIKILNWTPQYSDLSQIIAHAWQWHQKRHGCTSHSKLKSSVETF